MIIATKGDWREHVEGRKTAWLSCGPAGFADAAVKRFAPGDGRRLFETLKRFVSSGDFQAIVVLGFDLVLASCNRQEVLSWIGEHLEDEPGLVLVLCDVDACEVPELNIC